MMLPGGEDNIYEVSYTVLQIIFHSSSSDLIFEVVQRNVFFWVFLGRPLKNFPSLCAYYPFIYSFISFDLETIGHIL